MNLFDKSGKAVAHLSEDQSHAIFLWEGLHIGVLVEDRHVFGINGKHLGWFVDGIIYDPKGHRIGFAEGTCPVPVSKITPKWSQRSKEKAMPKEKMPPIPNLTTQYSNQDFLEFLRAGEISPFER